MFDPEIKSLGSVLLGLFKSQITLEIISFMGTSIVEMGILKYFVALRLSNPSNPT